MMFDTSCPSGDDPRLKEYSMLFPNKLNTQEFLFCAMKKYCSVHLSWNTRRSPSIVLCFNTAISNATRSTEKKKNLWAKTVSYSSVSSQSPPDRATTISLNPPDRATTILCLITTGMNDRQICIANRIHNNLTLFMTFGFRR